VKSLVTPLAIALALSVGANAYAQRHDEKPHGTPPATTQSATQTTVTAVDSASQTIQLKDGGTLIIHTDGTVYHADASGRRVRMKNGVIMEGQDGKRYVMRNDAVWQTITQKGSLHPNH
jgi:copper resistance protein K